MKTHRKVEVAIIGAGTAGMMCARVGCMPSKHLIAAAEKAHAPIEAAKFGLVSSDVRIDGRKVIDRARRGLDAVARL